MFTKEMPKTISKMYDVAYRAEETLGKRFVIEKQSASGEYALIFKTGKTELLFAGFRFSLYQCTQNWFWLGVAPDWNRNVVDAFKKRHLDQFIRFENFLLCPFPEEMFERENYIGEAVSMIEAELEILAAAV